MRPVRQLARLWQQILLTHCWGTGDVMSMVTLLMYTNRISPDTRQHVSRTCLRSLSFRLAL
jgi:hypothetical protein